MINNIKNHFSNISKYNQTNITQALQKDVRQLDNGDTLSKVYVNNIIKSNGKFTPGRVKIELRKKDLRQKFNAPSKIINQLITQSDLNKLNTITNNSELETFMKQIINPKIEKALTIAKKRLGIAKTNANEKTNTKDERKILLKKRISEFYGKYLNENNLNKKLNYLSEDFNFKRSQLNAYTGNYNSFKKMLLNKLKVLYSYYGNNIKNVLTNADISKYKNINKSVNVNKFIIRFVYLYIKLIKPILIKKKYYGKIPTYNKLVATRKNIYDKKNKVSIPTNKTYKTKRNNNHVEINTAANEQYKLVPRARNTTNGKLLINSKVQNQSGRTVSSPIYNITTNSRSTTINKSNGSGLLTTTDPNNLKIKLRSYKPRQKKRITMRKKIASLLPNERLPKQNLYITNSNNTNSKNVNMSLLNLKKQQYANNLHTFSKFLRIKNVNKNKETILNDLSFIIWFDMCHDKLLPTKSYEDAVENNHTFYNYITGKKNYQNAINFSENMKRFINNLSTYNNIEIVLKNKNGKNEIGYTDYRYKNDDNIFENIEKILKLNPNTYVTKTINEALKNKNIEKYFVSINSKNNKFDPSKRVPNEHIYMSLTSFIDPGSFKTLTGSVLTNSKSGYISKIKRNFSPFKITLGNLKFSYNINKYNNNTTNINKIKKMLQINYGNNIKKRIIPGLTKSEATANNANFSKKLSKTFGDLMQILDIGSISGNEKVFFYTFDQTSALIYGYIRRYVFGQANINLILQRKAREYKIFF